MSYAHLELPAISMTQDECDRLERLARGALPRVPQAAQFLEREVSRAIIVEPGANVSGLVKMGSSLEFRDDVTGHVRAVTLVYPAEADLDAGRISVLTPVGAALIGMSAGQSIEWQTVSGGRRSLTVLKVKA